MTAQETKKRQIIPLVSPEMNITLQERQARVGFNMSAVYFMRPIYQWFFDMLALMEQSNSLKEVAPLLAYSTSQSGINPTNAGMTLWHMMTAEDDDEIRLRSVISATQIYRSPDNLSDNDIPVADLVASYDDWLTSMNTGNCDLHDVPQLLLGPIAAMQTGGLAITQWKINSMGPHDVNKGHYCVCLQRWDIQFDILVSFQEIVALAEMVDLFNDVDASDVEVDVDSGELPDPPAEVNVDMTH